MIRVLHPYRKLSARQPFQPLRGNRQGCPPPQSQPLSFPAEARPSPVDVGQFNPTAYRIFIFEAASSTGHFMLRISGSVRFVAALWRKRSSRICYRSITSAHSSIDGHTRNVAMNWVAYAWGSCNYLQSLYHEPEFMDIICNSL